MNQDALPICLDKRKNPEFFDEIQVGRFTRISFHRTLRIPEDGREYPLPAGFGRFPIHRVEDYADKVPTKWLEEGGFFIPLYQKEALFLQFEGVKWHPNIGKVCVGKINAISGKPYSEALSSQKQDYIVIPDQKWLDGICSGEGLVKQFVAMPLGQGYTIESQITDEEEFGGFQIIIYDSVLGRFPDRDPAIDKRIHDEEDPSFPRTLSMATVLHAAKPQIEMGIAAGGSIQQKIHKDIYGIESWDRRLHKRLNVHLVNSAVYKEITGRNAPPTPITTLEYQRAKIPWYSHFDEVAQGVKPPSLFKRILGISAIEKKRGISKNDETSERRIAINKIYQIATPDKKSASDLFRKSANESWLNNKWGAAIRDISYVIDLGEDVLSEDYVLRSCCNFHLGHYRDGATDASLALERDRKCLEALFWRAHCRKSLGDYDRLLEDANRLIENGETELLGLEFKAEAELLSEEYSEALDSAMELKRRSPGHQRADEIIREANMKMFGHDSENHHDI